MISIDNPYGIIECKSLKVWFGFITLSINAVVNNFSFDSLIKELSEFSELKLQGFENVITVSGFNYLRSLVYNIFLLIKWYSYYLKLHKQS